MSKGNSSHRIIRETLVFFISAFPPSSWYMNALRMQTHTHTRVLRWQYSTSISDVSDCNFLLFFSPFPLLLLFFFLTLAIVGRGSVRVGRVIKKTLLASPLLMVRKIDGNLSSSSSSNERKIRGRVSFSRKLNNNLFLCFSSRRFLYTHTHTQMKELSILIGRSAYVMRTRIRTTCKVTRVTLLNNLIDIRH